MRAQISFDYADLHASPKAAKVINALFADHDQGQLPNYNTKITTTMNRGIKCVIQQN
jgi:hypothetical protein